MSFRDGLRAVIREQQETWRKHVESRDPAAQAMREVQERAEASQERADGLKGVQYNELVDTHLSEGLHDYVMKSIQYQHTASMLAMSFSDADFKRDLEANQTAGAAALDADAWLHALIGAIRLAAIDLGNEGVAAFGTAKLADYPDGNYTLILSSIEGDPDVPFSGGEAFVVGTAIAKYGFTPDDADELAVKIVNVGPQEILRDVSLDTAVLMKQGLEILGLNARIKEGRSAQLATGRDPIPESVRHEVWRRDEGRCVDCGSRERLEFDHIIPVSRGGSNTARNLELRCETCNRSKGATI